ncbi:aspartyl/glutamyl-tRNA(Asn/Gln) amidotransferase subunit B [Paracoccidioides lutzii Pb01]|uniref:Glutamyl-tRNA(Gln) amidotransferase subunit B, mitochondrial n=1 Tax=Paracoccidioides lutzii (strain ATCC MYA-826 / Pb01) TaxID=502779 RepID=GATB_PARBA|nr:aspartyl/glutamyl-tRNA(Asn/Gln) amidotransferase subunit B [Paracoccidioides lutzii Pb01]C1GTX5.2 RecName: Full=Glutamyl-tRNA(Gln) amidotransferase subunit B, mitochondrial; Short=Glu-AdT subunit B [Paracoccidioides lutzii Pb01]EEH39781.2 aspartyl/glutamyl-tRNA(Asn/Gln) amidotransferase subunit B [Paracoccidioides lutzii Pb01]
MIRQCLSRRAAYPCYRIVAGGTEPTGCLYPQSCRISRRGRDWSSTSRRAIDTQTSGASNGADYVPLRQQLKEQARAKRAAKRKGEVSPPEHEDWELTVGIEIHAQLDTDTKLFSRASAAIDDVPNSNVALFDVALPGSQPLFQPATLIPALRAAIALNCDVQRVSRFDRKHYFYQDQPAGYQITQYYEPYAKNGSIWLGSHDGIAKEDGVGVEIGIKQIQMEQDTAKSQELPSSTYLLDFNRVSRPLIEIITLPQIHSPATAAACVRKIQTILQSVGAVTTGMEMGGLRADVNVSVRKRSEGVGDHQYHGVTGLGQRTEIKNLSSFKAVEDAIIAERDRQIAVLRAGGAIEGETRGWTLGSTETRKLRGKEGEVDYRYMPDPDLGPVIIGYDVLCELKAKLPVLPDALLHNLVQDPKYGLSIDDAKTLIELDDGDRLDYYKDAVDILVTLQKDLSDDFSGGKVVGNWVLHELGGLLTKSNLHWDSERVPAQSLAEIINLLSRNKITGSTAKSLFAMVFDGDKRSIGQIVEDENLLLQSLSREEYIALAEEVMRQNPKMVMEICEKRQLGKIGWLVGQIKRIGDRNRVEAQKAEEILRELILK